MIRYIKYQLNKLLYSDKKVSFPISDELILWQSFVYNKEPDKTEVPKIIWAYWHDLENMSPLIKAIINSWKKTQCDFIINVLDKNNLKDYLPELNISNYKDLHIANFSDIIRLNLLLKFGGVYLDCSVILQQNLLKYYQITVENHLDLLCFEGFGHMNKYLPITESWFLIAKPNNIFVRNWLSVLDKAFLSSNYENYFKKFHNEEYLSIHENGRSYLSVYIASQVAMKKTENIKIGLLDSKNNGFFYNYYFKYNFNKIAKFLLLQSNYHKFPSIIKLINKNRSPIDELINLKCYKKNSILGKYLK